jgi:hypothetical protein
VPAPEQVAVTVKLEPELVLGVKVHPVADPACSKSAAASPEIGTFELKFSANETEPLVGEAEVEPNEVTEGGSWYEI